jgi:hypothetical protein
MDDDADDASDHDKSAMAAGPEPGPVNPTEIDPGRGQAKPLNANLVHRAGEYAVKILCIMYPTREDVILQGRRHTKDGNPDPQGHDQFWNNERSSVEGTLERALITMNQVGGMRFLDRAVRFAEESLRVKCKSTRGRWWGNSVRSWLASEGPSPKRSGPP